MKKNNSVKMAHAIAILFEQLSYQRGLKLSPLALDYIDGVAKLALEEINTISKEEMQLYVDLIKKHNRQ